MDFIKEKLGVEVQFGKYSFMVYNVCAKMQFIWDLEQRGVADIDIPVLILGIDR